MKKIILIFMILICAVSLNAQKKIATYTINQVVGEQYYKDLVINVEYDSEKDKVYLDVDGRKVSKFLILEKNDRIELVKLLNKALSWKAKADSTKAIFEKEIGFIDVEGGFIYGDNYKISNINHVILKFCGQGDNPYITNIYMVIPSMEAYNNEFMTCDLHIIFFDVKGIKELIFGLTTAIDEFNKKEIQNKNIGSQFN